MIAGHRWFQRVWRWSRSWPAKCFDESSDLDGEGEKEIRPVGEELLLAGGGRVVLSKSSDWRC